MGITGSAQRLWHEGACSRTGRIGALLLVALLGAWLGLVAAGPTPADIGPVITQLSVQPALGGGTVVNLAPLGSLRFASHHGPFQLDVDVTGLNAPLGRQLAAHPADLRSLEPKIASDLRSALVRLLIRSGVAALLGALVLALMVFRRPSAPAASTGICLAVLVAAGGITAATYNPIAVREPRYTGLLTHASALMGTAQDIAARFATYRQELAGLVTNISGLYNTTLARSPGAPDPATVRVLHVSDIHDNVAAWNVMHAIVSQFRINAIIDTGDLSDHGSDVENRLFTAIPTFGIPYVYVRGNHDSPRTQAFVQRQRNALVLTGTVVTVEGLRLIGEGDPRFTPDRSVAVAGEDAVRAMGEQLAAKARATHPPPDIALVHDPTAAGPLAGTVPLVLAGHIHRRSSQVLGQGTLLLVEGSTGGAGLRALETQPATPLECSVLYFDRASRRLLGWDEITLGGLGQATAEITRHLAGEATTVVPSPPVTPSSPAPRGAS